MSKRIFYVVYLDNAQMQAALDTIRFIANPAEKTRAHITVRGPYTRPVDIAALGRELSGTEVMADGIDSFLREDQNTVFIRCRSEPLREVWQKKDFGFNPHITIYDGPSREFALKLLERLSILPNRFYFVVGQMTRLVTHKGQLTTSLREAFDDGLTRRLLGRPLGISEIQRMPADRRVALIELIARKIPEFTSSNNARAALALKNAPRQLDMTSSEAHKEFPLYARSSAPRNRH